MSDDLQTPYVERFCNYCGEDILGNDPHSPDCPMNTIGYCPEYGCKCRRPKTNCNATGNDETDLCECGHNFMGHETHDPVDHDAEPCTICDRPSCGLCGRAATHTAELGAFGVAQSCTHCLPHWDEPGLFLLRES
jgi:hypothetical protein